MHVGDIIGSAVAGNQSRRCWRKGSRYTVLDLLGRGTFGQVFKCRDEECGRLVAVKVLKNKSAYFRQGLLEIAILTAVNSECDPDGGRHTLRLLDHFLYQNHLCIVNELLSMSLYDVIKSGGFRGVTVRLARAFLRQLLDALCAIEARGIVHCDLKPENVLLTKPGASAITLIDFGSACFEESTLYTYIQSRHYRAPEVILGLQYSCAIDMWSLGCIAAELFLGIPIFPGNSEYNQLFKITSMLGPPPPEMVEAGVHAGKFFRADTASPNRYVLKTPAEYERDANVSLEPDKRYMNYQSLEDFAENVPMKTGYASSSLEDAAEIRRSFLSFLKGVLEFDPTKRLTPDQALQHPFLAEVPLGAGYAPAPPPQPESAGGAGGGRRRRRPREIAPARPGPLKLPAGVPSKAAGLSAAEIYGVFIKALRENGTLVDVASGIELCRMENEVLPRRTVELPPDVPKPEYSMIRFKRQRQQQYDRLSTSPYSGSVSDALEDAAASYAAMAVAESTRRKKRDGGSGSGGGKRKIDIGVSGCGGDDVSGDVNGDVTQSCDDAGSGKSSELRSRHSKSSSLARRGSKKKLMGLDSPTNPVLDESGREDDDDDGGKGLGKGGFDGEDSQKKRPKSQLKKSRKITILELENENGMLSLASPMMSASMARTAKKEAKEAKLAAEEARSKERLMLAGASEAAAEAASGGGGGGAAAAAAPQTAKASGSSKASSRKSSSGSIKLKGKSSGGLKKKKSGAMTTTSLTSMATSRGMLESIPEFSLNGNGSKESGNSSLCCSGDDNEIASPKTFKLKKKKSDKKKKTKRKELCIDDDEDDDVVDDDVVEDSDDVRNDVMSDVTNKSMIKSGGSGDIADKQVIKSGNSSSSKLKIKSIINENDGGNIGVDVDGNGSDNNRKIAKSKSKSFLNESGEHNLNGLNGLNGSESCESENCIDDDDVVDDDVVDDDDDDDDDDGNSGAISYAEDVVKKAERRKKKKKKYKKTSTSRMAEFAADIEVPSSSLSTQNGTSLTLAALSVSPQSSHLHKSEGALPKGKRKSGAGLDLGLGKGKDNDAGNPGSKEGKLVSSLSTSSSENEHDGGGSRETRKKRKSFVKSNVQKDPSSSSSKPFETRRSLDIKRNDDDDDVVDEHSPSSSSESESSSSSSSSLSSSSPTANTLNRKLNFPIINK